MGLLGLAFMLALACTDMNSRASEESGFHKTVTPQKRDMKPEIADEAWHDLIQGTMQFAWALFQQVWKPDQNICLSPYSIATAFGMVYAGAKGTTRMQMQSGFHYIPQDELHHHGFNKLDLLMQQRNQGDRVRLSIVNSIWSQTGMALVPDFLNLLQREYGADLNQLNFSEKPDASRRFINLWVADQTEHKVTDLLPENSVDIHTRLVLTNAVYFLAQWLIPFEIGRNTEAPFHKLDGTTVSIPFMNNAHTYNYAENGYAQIVELPYDGEHLVMTLILPTSQDLDTFMQALDWETWQALWNNRSQQQLNLSIPKWKFTYQIALKQTLQTLGIQDLFSERADLSGITTSSNLFVDDAYHKTFIEVNEQGTEAAAATGVVMSKTAVPQGMPITFDHPFLFFITDVETGVILFQGSMVDPQAG